MVKGAVRPKSQFLGQYDLNYTCEILYYARSKGELHALRECSPLELREELRRNYRALIVAGYYRKLAGEFSPDGPDCREWYDLLDVSLSHLRADIQNLLAFEMQVLNLLGLQPELESLGEGGFALRGERRMPITAEVSEFLGNPLQKVKNSQIPLDAARVIGVFYQFHLDCSPEVRRSVLRMIS